MRKRARISIPQPCSEKWKDMKLHSYGRFCQKCEKTIIDYSTLSDGAIRKKMDSPEGLSCGRFHVSQLGRDLKVENQSENWMKRFALASSLISILSASARSPVKKGGQDIIQSSDQGNDASGFREGVMISGVVLDEEGHAIADALVVVVKGRKEFRTDERGMFEFRLMAEDGDVMEVVISKEGYAPYTLVFNVGEALKCMVVKMKANTKSVIPDSTMISGLVIDDETGEPLPFANILIGDGLSVANTDFEGKFAVKLTHLDGKDIKVKASYVGYMSSEKVIDLTTLQSLEIRLTSAHWDSGIFVVGIVSDDDWTYKPHPVRRWFRWLKRWTGRPGD